MNSSRPLSTEERKFLARLQTVNPETDPLWRGVMWVIAKNLEVEIEVLGGTKLEDSEAHRLRGRMGMLIELERQLSGWLERAQKDTPPESEE